MTDSTSPRTARRVARTTLAAALLALSAGCAGGLARKDDAAQFRYQDYAGDPVETVDTMGRVTGWSSVSRTQLVIARLKNQISGRPFGARGATQPELDASAIALAPHDRHAERRPRKSFD